LTALHFHTKSSVQESGEYLKSNEGYADLRETTM